MYQGIIEKTQELIKEQNFEKLKRAFVNISPYELDEILKFLKNFDYLQSIIENIDLNEEEIKRSLVLYLAIYNLAKSVVKDEIKVHLKTFELLKELDHNLQIIIKKVYILLGIYLILQEKYFSFSRGIMLILKYFDEMGIFELSIWGIKIKWDEAMSILDSINEALIEKLIKRYKNLSKDSFLSFYNL